MKNKLNIIIALICAVIVTVSVYLIRDYIFEFFHPTPEPVVSSNNDDLFDSFNEEKEGEFTYKALSDNYYGIKTLALSIDSKTIVTENGKVVDTKTDYQEFKYAKTYKLMVKSKERSLYCDGKEVTNYIPQAKTYMTEPISEEFFSAMVNGSPALNTIGLLIGIDYSSRIKDYKNMGKDTVGNYSCNKIEITLDGQGQVPDFTQKLWLEEKTGVIIKNVYEIKRVVPNNGKNTNIVMTVSNITKNFKLNEPIKDSEFKFVPSFGDMKYDPKKDAALMEKEAQLMEQMKNAPLEAPMTDINPEAIKEEPKVSPEEMKKQMEKASPLNKQIYNFKAGKFKPSLYRGKKLIIVFWAYGMGDNVLTSVTSFANSNKDRYEVVTINVNTATKGLKEHVQSNKYPVPVYYINEKDTENTVKKLQLITLPAIYFVDEIGVVRAVLYGNSALAQIQKTAIEKLNRDNDIPKKEEEKKPDISTDNPITNEIKPDIQSEEEPEIEISTNKEEAK